MKAKFVTAGFMLLAQITICQWALADDLTGDWKITVESTVSGNITDWMKLEQTGEELKGVYTSQGGNVPLKGTVKGSSVVFQTEVDGGAVVGKVTLTYSGTLEDEKVRGDLTIGQLGNGTFQATRVP